MQRSLIVFFLVGLLTTVVQASKKENAEACIDCFDFAAPSVVDATTVNPAEVGLIVFDTMDENFKGKSNTQGWKNLSLPQNPTGTILMFGGTTAPTGYLIADGSAVSRTTYADLFAVIGTAFGSGDGSTTFNLPDFRGKFARGVDNGAGNDPDTAGRTACNTGGATGDNVGSCQADQVGPHSHNLQWDVTGGVGGANAVRKGDTQDGSGSSNIVLSNGTTETRPRNVYVNYIIKI